MRVSPELASKLTRLRRRTWPPLGGVPEYADQWFLDLMRVCDEHAFPFLDWKDAEAVLGDKAKIKTLSLEICFGSLRSLAEKGAENGTVHDADARERANRVIDRILEISAGESS